MVNGGPQKKRVLNLAAAPLLQNLIERLMLLIFTIWTGLTISFLVTRLSPRNPAEQVLSRIQGAGVFMRPEEIEVMRRTIMGLFGLDKPIWEQYFSFIQSVFTFRFGPSLLNFPVAANDIISIYMPWTIFLLLTATLISWIIGVVTGIVMSIREHKRGVRVLEYIFITMFPLPYVVLAIAFLIIFVGVLRVYIGVTIIPKITLSLETLWAMFSRAWLPALSIIVLSSVNWAMGSLALARTAKREPHVFYAMVRGIPTNLLLKRYIGKNVLILQITALALSLGNIFGGALVTEYIFNYPGLGTLLYQSIVTNDFNTMLGVTTYSILGVATASFMIDMIYPFIDPRVRYGGGE
ncbi:MAG: ABC transporter permease [Ignisphaera sp.]|nr:ABC transporter permease [Ignisphaera sp.]MCX8167625.1 ABC transporter permease [Ignisphaera sp.]MDW8085964.1 ABC transporter permease [Ignisphaera sp.]